MKTLRRPFVSFCVFNSYDND